MSETPVGLRRPPTVSLMAAIVILAVCACGCVDQRVPTLLHDTLSGVTSREEERAAFEKISAYAEHDLAFNPMDEGGKTVDMSQPAWWNEVRTIHLKVKGESVHHKLIDGENLGILMRE